MHITKYGLQLSSLEPNDLELVRHWRNADRVRLFMEYQHIIQKEEQINWFTKLDKLSNFYFVISYQHQKIGLVNIKDVDLKNKSAEAGIFFGENQFVSTMIPFLATAVAMDFAFDILKLQTLKAKINRENTKVIDFNVGLGYQLFQENKTKQFDYYQVSSSAYKKSTIKWKAILDKWNSNCELKLTEQEARFLEKSFQFKLNNDSDWNTRVESPNN